MFSFAFAASRASSISFLFFFNDTATTEIYTLSLHDALPISLVRGRHELRGEGGHARQPPEEVQRSEEHTSELQSHLNLVCRLLLEKKKKLDGRTIRPHTLWRVFKGLVRATAAVAHGWIDLSL